MNIVVPEGMLNAAMQASMAAGLPIGPSTELRIPIEAALLWLSENPIVPTEKQAHELWKVALELDPDRNENDHAAKNLVIAWQRRMFLAPEQQLIGFNTPFGRFEIDSRVPPGEIRLHSWNGPTLVNNIGTEEEND